MLYRLSYTPKKFENYRANSNKKTIIKANNAIASVKANPKIAILNSSSFNDGFLEIPRTKAPNTVPIPTPAPANPIVAKPAPIYLAACSSINHYYMVYAKRAQKAADIVCFKVPNFDLIILICLFCYVKILVLTGNFAPPVFKAAIIVFVFIPDISNKTVPPLTLAPQ